MCFIIVSDLDIEYNTVYYIPFFKKILSDDKLVKSITKYYV